MIGGCIRFKLFLQLGVGFVAIYHGVADAVTSRKVQKLVGRALNILSYATRPVTQAIQNSRGQGTERHYPFPKSRHISFANGTNAALQMLLAISSEHPDTI